MRAAALVFVLAACSSAARAAEDEPTTTPYRPSVSTPAALSAPGWLEIEAGWQHDHDEGGVRRDSIPMTFKLAFSQDWGIRLGNEAWVRLRSDERNVSGYGDTSFVVKRRFGVDEAQAFGLEAGVIMPSGHHGIGFGSGKADYGINGIYSADFGGAWHTDVNLQATRLGQAEPGASRTQWLFAASLARQLDDRWSVVGEFSGTRQQGAEDARQLLVAASYNVGKRLTIDAGASRSLRSGPPVWQAFTGFTWLAARVL